MKKIIIASLFLGVLIVSAQDIKSLKKLKAQEVIENIVVEKISSNKNMTTFVIWIKDGVKLHKHEHHTENIYVLEGKGIMTIGETENLIKAGDQFIIPENTPHGLTVTSSKPMKVISIQSPEFNGDDRIFIE